MKQISSFDLYYLTKEMQELVGSRLDSFFFNSNVFTIRIYQKYKGQFFINSNMGKYLYFDNKREEGSTPTPFVQYMRKSMSNAYITAIEQIPSERILKFTIDKKEEDMMVQYYLYLELFSPGNVVLTDTNNNIINLLFRKNFRDRILKIKEQYELPPKKELSIHSFNSKNFQKLAKESDLELVKFLAISLGIGGKYSEEICIQSNIDKNKKANEITNDEINTIEKQINFLLNTKTNGQLIIDEENHPINFTPFKFKSMSDTKDMPSFNETIKTYFEANKEEKDQREEQFKQALKKLQNRLQKQQKMLEEVEKSYEEQNNIGNKIYENYADIEELLKLMKTNPQDAQNNKLVKKVNAKNNEIIIEL